VRQQQFCYYSQGSSDDFNASMKYNIAFDRVLVTPGRDFPVNIQQAFSNCVWWQTGGCFRESPIAYSS
jgi:hypothetical protein